MSGSDKQCKMGSELPVQIKYGIRPFGTSEIDTHAVNLSTCMTTYCYLSYETCIVGYDLFKAPIQLSRR